MFLSLTTSYEPATDLGYLLHKNPGKVQSFNLPFGQAHVYYSETSPTRCTANLLLDIDPIGLVRDRKGSGEGGLLDQYVNDRPYAASSFLSVALAQVYGSALNGNSRDRPELTEIPLPLTARITALPCRGGEAFLRRLFEPLGYEIKATQQLLDDQFPDWGKSPYFTVELSQTCRLHELLSHLYVLIPSLDNDKHYWVDEAEVQKLLKHGEGWLSTHPERERIAERYLKRQRKLVRSALEQLIGDPEDTETSEPEEFIEKKQSLHESRLSQVAGVLKESGAKRILDLGCGEGKLLRLLAAERQFTEVVGLDVSSRSLEIAEDRLRRGRFFDEPGRVKLLQGSLMYRDVRLNGFDAAAVVEVIEHLDPHQLRAFQRVVFEFARPKLVVITTPNSEYNVKFPNLPVGKFRHRDHRFEWTRNEFQEWSHFLARKFGYAVEFIAAGDEDPIVGPPTQMGVFRIK